MLRTVLAAALLLSATVQDPAAKPAGTSDLQKLAWLCGTWSLVEDGKTTEEHWRPLAGDMLLGTSHTYDGKRSHFFEFLRIAARGGQLAYIAMPGGAKATVFLAKEIADGRAVFENPSHDHPQRITYEKTSDGITATISQLDGSRAKAFAYQRR